MRAASERTQSAPKEPTRAATGSTQALSHPKKVETPLSRRPNAKNSWRKQFPHGLRGLRIILAVLFRPTLNLRLATYKGISALALKTPTQPPERNTNVSKGYHMERLNPSRLADLRGRSSIITAVKTPLGFFVIVLLVVEFVSLSISSLSNDSEMRHIFGLFAVIIIVLLVGLVSLFSWYRPEALFGHRPDRSLDTTRPNMSADNAIPVDYPMLSRKSLRIALIRSKFACENGWLPRDLNLPVLGSLRLKPSQIVIADNAASSDLGSGPIKVLALGRIG